jgi:phage repressor protein C with HTH and peptisase S24 domain
MTGGSVGHRLKEERRRTGLGQKDFGERCGVSKTSQFNYEADDRYPDTQYLQAAHALGVDVCYVLTGSRLMGPEAPFVVIPHLDSLHAATAGIAAEPPAAPSRTGLSCNRRWLQSRNLHAHHLRVVEVEGDSMAGRLRAGDQALIDLTQTTPRSGYAYALQSGAEVLVKYCQLMGNGLLRVSSENPSYPSYDVDLASGRSVSIIGRVVASFQGW